MFGFTEWSPSWEEVPEMLFIVLVYLWPIPILAYSVRGNRKKIKMALWCCECPLIVFTSYILWVAVNLSVLGPPDPPDIGAYLGLVAVVLFTATWIYELVMMIKSKKLMTSSFS